MSAADDEDVVVIGITHGFILSGTPAVGKVGKELSHTHMSAE